MDTQATSAEASGPDDALPPAGALPPVRTAGQSASTERVRCPTALRQLLWPATFQAVGSTAPRATALTASPTRKGVTPSARAVRRSTPR